MINFIYIFELLLSIIFLFFEIYFFLDIFKSSYIIINLGFKALDFSTQNPLIWLNIKYLFITFSFISKFIFFHSILNKIFHVNLQKRIKKADSYTDQLYLILGRDINSTKNIILPEKGLYQNILITGAIGSGKTSSAMYPITKQLISYKADSKDNKLGMLILDVKGNYYYEVMKYAKQYNREDDVITIGLSSKYNYNPLDNTSLSLCNS